MKKKVTLLTLALSTIFGTFSQADPHFSMFTESPVFYNPATAGFTPGDLQLFTNYRLQWNTVTDNPYRTITASADWRMFDNGGGGHLGAGINFYNDGAGLSQFQSNVIALPVNYTMLVSKAHKISFGIQPAFYQRTIKNDQVNWQNQWNGVAFDPSFNSNELLLNQNLSVSRFDLSVGGYWEGYLRDNAKLKVGISGQHLTKQRINFTSEDAQLYRKLNFHAQGVFRNDETGVSILPAIYFFVQGPNKELILGSNYRFLLKSASSFTSYFEEVTLSVGTYFRWKDAIIVNAIFDVAGFSFGAAYDLNVSKLSSSAKGVGSMEFFIKYRIQFGTRNLRNNRVH